MGKFYTTKEIADTLGVSKQRVYRYIKANHISEAHRETVKGNTVMMYDSAVFERIKEGLKSNSTSSEAHRETHKEAPNEAVYEALIKQLEIKDKQIAELQKALDQEQQLHLLSKQRTLALEETQGEQKETADTEQQEKKGFFSRLFRM